MSKVLVIATSSKTRGGITSVVQSYIQTPLWQNWECRWLGTHIDSKGPFPKLAFFVRSFFTYLFVLPKYSIVHIHLSEPISAIRKTFFFLIAYLARKRIILHFHSFSPGTTINGRFAWLYRFLFTRADVIIALSEYWKGEIEKSIPGTSPVKVLYNPAMWRERDANPWLPREQFILFAGTLNQRKGFTDLIEAFATFASRYPGWNLVLAGNGEIEKGRVLVTKLGIDRQVQFRGWVSGPAKEELFRKAALFCLPSYAEGFPMAILDAMAYGIPVLATPVGGTMDLFRDNQDLLTFMPGDLATMAAQLEKLILSEPLRVSLANSSRQRIRTDFDILTLSRKLELIYEELAPHNSNVTVI